MKRMLYCIVTLLITSTLVIADRPLDETEVLELLKQLCQQSTSGWIQQGRIEAAHLSSDATSGETVETQESVITDGERFAWNIRINSREQAATAKKQDADDFLTWNQDRTFVWDGWVYTLYFNPGNHAIVYEQPSIPVNVTGPLKAGFLPWGYGILTYEKLSAGALSAMQTADQEGPKIQLFAEPNKDLRIELVLDPGKAYAVQSYTLFRPGFRTVQTYGDFTEHAGRWIPKNIRIDRYEGSRFRSSDLWEITLLKDTLPQPDSFTPALRQGAMVQYHSPILESPLFYRYSKERNMQSLLDKRFIAALKKDVQKQNCATVAAEKMLSAFGISVTDTELQSLVHDSSNRTSLYQIQQLMLKKRLFCLPIKTNIAGLERFKDSQVLLHFPRKKHFVVLDKIEKTNVWLVDLDRPTFYYSMDRELFLQAWAGIALVVSDKPTSMNPNDRPVPDKVLQNIVGAADYSCQLIQKNVIETCPKMSPVGTCGGRYTAWSDYYACQPGSEGDFCVGTGMPGGTYSPCIETGDGQCDASGEYTVDFSIRMCTL